MSGDLQSRVHATKKQIEEKTGPDTRHKMRLDASENNTGQTDGRTDGRTDRHALLQRCDGAYKKRGKKGKEDKEDEEEEERKKKKKRRNMKDLNAVKPSS